MDWFTAARDAWWNLDFLGLVAQRLGLDDVGAVLDVGSGKGHWGQTLLSVLPPQARLAGVDPEPAWNQAACSRAHELGLGERCDYAVGTAEALPFPDASFDLVTCQTVLIHVSDPTAAIEEMARVLAPGGQLLLVEPNNQAAELVRNSVTSSHAVERRAAAVRFHMLCEAGRVGLGFGDNSVGDKLPVLLAHADFEDVQVYLADKAFTVVPPYDEEARQLLDEQLQFIAKRISPWPEEEARRYFLAGGGEEGEFEVLWAERMGENEQTRIEIEAERYWSAGATVMYLASGRKNAAP